MASLARNRDLVLYLAASVAAVVATEMQSVAIGWQVYAQRHRTLDLGFVGFAQFVPAAALSLVAGQLADRVDRRTIMLACGAGYLGTSLALAGLASFGHLPLLAVYGVLVGFGVTRAFAGPASHALVSNLVATEQLTAAVAWESTAWQLAVILGPALGGAVYAVGHDARAVYVTSALLEALSFLLIAAMHVRHRAAARAARGATDLWGGVRYVRAHPMILGSISLDLFAVLLGGAVALLPAVAHDVLHVGAAGLGVLRSAPAVGAAVTALVLARRPLRHHAGAAMLACVAIFGTATVLFGVSRWFPLSLAMLVLVGASDMVSVVVRRSLLQLATPDAMRGRVGAVNLVFVGASNELGEFESGVTAAWLGTVPAIVVGGIGTLVVVALWALLFPTLRRIDRLEDLRPAAD